MNNLMQRLEDAINDGTVGEHHTVLHEDSANEIEHLKTELEAERRRVRSSVRMTDHETVGVRGMQRAVAQQEQLLPPVGER